MRYVVAALALWLVAAPAAAVTIPDDYDRSIREAAETYLPGWDYRLYKAQLYQESKLDPDAKSSAGAQGIAQIMPGTFEWIAPKAGVASASPYAAEAAIEVGAVYMARLRSQWSAPRPSMDRFSLSAASYNAGLGHLLEAQRRCGGPNRYRDIIQCLPDVTGRHASETKQYLRRIWRWFRLLLIGG